MRSGLQLSLIPRRWFCGHAYCIWSRSEGRRFRCTFVVPICPCLLMSEDKLVQDGCRPLSGDSGFEIVPDLPPTPEEHKHLIPPSAVSLSLSLSLLSLLLPGCWSNKCVHTHVYMYLLCTIIVTWAPICIYNYYNLCIILKPPLIIPNPMIASILCWPDTV